MVAIGGYLAGLDVVTPTINANFPKDFSPFFATSAQVIAALLVALVVEQASFLQFDCADHEGGRPVGASVRSPR